MWSLAGALDDVVVYLHPSDLPHDSLAFYVHDGGYIPLDHIEGCKRKQRYYKRSNLAPIRGRSSVPSSKTELEGFLFNERALDGTSLRLLRISMFFGKGRLIGVKLNYERGLVRNVGSSEAEVSEEASSLELEDDEHFALLFVQRIEDAVYGMKVT